jgi:hypothetical protein
MINARKRLLETTVMFAIPAVALYMLHGIADQDAKFFPQYICYGMLLLACINALQLLAYLNKIRPISWPTFLRWSLPFKDKDHPFPVRRVGTALGLLLAYAAGMEWLGFYSAGFLFFLLTLLALSPERPTLATAARKALYALCFMSVVYLLFTVMLGVVIPSGVLL